MSCLGLAFEDVRQ